MSPNGSKTSVDQTEVKIRTLCSNNEANEGSTEAFPPKNGSEEPVLETAGVSLWGFDFLPMLNNINK